MIACVQFYVMWLCVYVVCCEEYHTLHYSLTYCGLYIYRIMKAMERKSSGLRRSTHMKFEKKRACIVLC